MSYRVKDKEKNSCKEDKEKSLHALAKKEKKFRTSNRGKNSS